MPPPPPQVWSDRDEDWAVDGTQLTPRVMRRMTPERWAHVPIAKGAMVVHLFEHLARHVRQGRPHTLADGDLRTFWEKGWMMQEEFLPPLIRPGVVTNERFGWVEQQRWHEWNLPSAKVIRYFWNKWTQGLNAQCHHRIRTLGSELFFALPGPHADCTRCGWTMPGSEMWNETLCAYCRHRESYPYAQLTYVRGVPVLLPHETSAVRTECQLIRTFQTLQLYA